MNNATYAAYAENMMIRALEAAGWSPSDFKAQGFAVQIRRFHIQYQSPALWGDTLAIAADIVALKATGGTWYIEIKRTADGEPITRCLLEWSLVNRISGEEQTMPESLFHTLKKIGWCC